MAEIDTLLLDDDDEGEGSELDGVRATRDVRHVAARRRLESSASTA